MPYFDVQKCGACSSTDDHKVASEQLRQGPVSETLTTTSQGYNPFIPLWILSEDCMAQA